MELFIARFFALDTVPRYIENISWIDTIDKQQYLVERTVLEKSCSDHPFPPKHAQSLLEAVVRTCESERIPVAEIVYEQLAKSLTSSFIPDHCFGQYHVDDVCVIFETDATSASAFVREGSTGFCTWEAGKCLSWFLCENYRYNNESILELGCGTGVTGIVVAKYLGLDDGTYTFSDYHESTLDQARRNCKINNVHGQFKRIDILDNQRENLITTDVVVGADILYDEELCSGLVEWLSNSEISQFKEALIMSTIRTDSTYESFKQALGEHKDNVEFTVIHRMTMSEWIEAARQSSRGEHWARFLDSNKRLFDPIIELVRIVKTR